MPHRNSGQWMIIYLVTVRRLMWIWMLQFIRTDFISKKTLYEESVKATDYNYLVEDRCIIVIRWGTLKYKGVCDVEEGGVHF